MQLLFQPLCHTRPGHSDCRTDCFRTGFDQGKINRVAVILALEGCAITIWLVSNFLAYSATEEAIAIWWSKAAYLGIPFIPIAMYQFTVAVPGIENKYNKFIWAGWVISALFSATGIRRILVTVGRRHASGPGRLPGSGRRW
jgi:hypothetical protein